MGGPERAVRIMGEDAGTTPAFEMIGPPVFSPDSSRLAYGAIPSKGKVRAVIDDEVGPEFGELWANVVFSPDSRRVAYLALRRKQGLFGPRATWGAVVDGVLSGEWDEVASPPHFSPDSRHVAFNARRGKEWFMVVDGAPGAAFKQVGPPRFGADGRLWHLVERLGAQAPFAICADGRVVVEFDEGSEVAPGESFYLGRDGRHMASAVRIGETWHPVVDDSVGPGCSIGVGEIGLARDTITFPGLRDDGIHSISFDLADGGATTQS